MNVKRRDLIKFSAAVAGLATLGSMSGCQNDAGTSTVISGDNSADKKAQSVSSFSHLKPMLEGTKPISVTEYQFRIEKVQRLMTENDLAAIFLDADTSLQYFTGIKWHQSERLMAAVIPAKGDVKYISPAFEEEKLRELIKVGSDVRIWQEHESPFKRVAQVFEDLGILSGRIGMEERVRFFLFDGIRQQAPHLEYISADPVTIPCRMFKSSTEIALMQRSMNITIEAYKACIPLLEEGMQVNDFVKLSTEAFAALGVYGKIWCSFADATAYPHGSSKPQYLKKGDVVLMDGGCYLHGYASDISRTIVFGNEPTERQIEIWNLEKKAQMAGFNAAQLGVACEEVDIAARKVLVDAGFGPDYKVPGLPHRTGHGIGMDLHEWGNMVLGNKQPLDVGMCFSVEPMIAIYGEFGVRLEDCVHMTENGPKWFTEPSPSITEPFAA